MDSMLNKPDKAVTARKTAAVAEGLAAKTAAPAVRAASVTRVALARDTGAGEDRYRMIAERAYFRAEQRGFTPGRELDDWLAAEIEVDELIGSTEARA